LEKANSIDEANKTIDWNIPQQKMMEGDNDVGIEKIKIQSKDTKESEITGKCKKDRYGKGMILIKETHMEPASFSE